MNYDKVMKSVGKLFNNWINDETLDDHHRGNKVVHQKNMMMAIQQEIKSDFIVLTKDELMEEMQKYHASMEGYEY
jgi:hypothetical protein|tara:strand:- start:1982 stop:2206 length:225 start_codon:yes stop_codon:yes gene_type:complete